VSRVILPVFFAILFCLQGAAQESSDPVAQALSQGDLYLSKHKYELALDAYHKADKLAHHTSAAAFLKIATIDKKAGAFSEALEEARKAIKAASDNKSVNIQVLQFRAGLLAQMAGKPTDKKLKEAEAELREALALDAANPVTHLDLGMILLRQERDAEGIPELNTYIASPGANPATVAETRLVIANPIRARLPFAPNFSFTTQDNQEISNASLRGKVVLMDFWGTWCPPCRESVPIAMPKTVFYASRKGQWDGQHLDIPSIRISAVSSRLDAVNLDTFQQIVEKMSAASGLQLTGPPVEFRVKKHPFVRADFDRSVGAVHMYQSMVQTIAGDYLLTMEVYAYSSDELQRVAASLQTMDISDEDP